MPGSFLAIGPDFRAHRSPRATSRKKQQQRHWHGAPDAGVPQIEQSCTRTVVCSASSSPPAASARSAATDNEKPLSPGCSSVSWYHLPVSITSMSPSRQVTRRRLAAAATAGGPSTPQSPRGLGRRLQLFRPKICRCTVTPSRSESTCSAFPAMPSGPGAPKNTHTARTLGKRGRRGGCAPGSSWSSAVAAGPCTAKLAYHGDEVALPPSKWPTACSTVTSPRS
mmetsp:Transcript_8773/g.22076  ORF Transcript_8773/g.22076 Transcript_8773/m.22076 type:complete len:224 (+) Transcript_8773:524-1195(+)